LKGPFEQAIQHPPELDHQSYSTLERHVQPIDLVKANVEKAQQHQGKVLQSEKKEPVL